MPLMPRPDVPTQLSSWGGNITAARLEEHLSQEELARDCGVSVKTVQRWESGELLPRAAHQGPLARALRRSVTSLLPRDDSEAAVMRDFEAIGRGCS